ncbi:MAG: efflux RND transporter periplasmic adaptor subunit [Victivallaceae bacterium]|nr:efflux RND transporter periplasmic adaptor subunit [Victivallaceae bacterium]
MRKIIFLIIGVVIVGALGYGIAVRINNPAKKNRGRTSPAKAGTGIAVPVEIAPVSIRKIRNIHIFTGTLEPWSKYEVAPKIAGRLENLNVEIGDPVYNGQLLATIDDEEYLQEINKASADLGISEALKGEAITQFNLAKIEFDRATGLKKKRVISDSEYDSKRSAYLVKAATLKRAQAELNQKQAALNLAKVRYDFTKIYARWGRKNLLFDIASPGPTKEEVKKVVDDLMVRYNVVKRYGIEHIDFRETAPGKFILELELATPLFNFAQLASGIARMLAEMKQKLSPATTINFRKDTTLRYIGKKYLDAGQMLKANDAILTIVDIRRMKAMVNVIEKDYPLLKSGQPAVVTTDAYPDRTFAGKVYKITKVLDEYSRQAEVEIEIDNSQLLLRPGMFVKVSIEFATLENAQVIPKHAVVNFNDVTGVFMLSADRKTVRFIPVKTGLMDGDNIQIVSPILVRPVVTLGNHLLYNGIAINITSRDEAMKGRAAAAAGGKDNSGKSGRKKTAEAK